MEGFLVGLYKAGGLVLVFAGVLCAMALAVMWHVLKQNTRIFEAFVASMKSWQQVIDSISKTIETHNANAQEYHKNASKACEYQREEHKDLTAGLVKMMETFSAEHAKRMLEHTVQNNKLDIVLSKVQDCNK